MNIHLPDIKTRRIVSFVAITCLSVAVVSLGFNAVRPQNDTTPRVLGAVDIAVSTDAQIADITAKLQTTFTHFDTMISQKQMDAAGNDLLALQDYQQRALALWSQLSAAQKTALTAVCTATASMLEADLHLLPESKQLDGMLVASGCQALQDAPQ